MTSYGLDDLGFEPRWGKDLPIETGCRGPPILLYNGYRISFAGIKWPGRGPNQTPLQDPGSNIGTAIKLVPLPPTYACWQITGQLNLIIPVGRCRAYSTNFPFSFRLKYLRKFKCTSTRIQKRQLLLAKRQCASHYVTQSVHNRKTPSTFEGTTFFRNDGNHKATQHHISENLNPQIY